MFGKKKEQSQKQGVNRMKRLRFRQWIKGIKCPKRKVCDVFYDTSGNCENLEGTDTCRIDYKISKAREK